MLEDQNTCVKGYWENGVCICDSGYATLFSDTALHSIYCNHEIRVDPLPTEGLAACAYIAATVAFAVVGVLALTLFLYYLVSLKSMGVKMQKVRQEIYDFTQKQTRREEKDLYYDIWELPSNEFIGIIEEETKKPADDVEEGTRAKVIHAYKKQGKNEINLPKRGDIVTNVVKLENGWCKGMLKNEFGFFPAAYVEML